MKKRDCKPKAGQQDSSISPGKQRGALDRVPILEFRLYVAKIAISSRIMQISCAPDLACPHAKLKVCYPC